MYYTSLDNATRLDLYRKMAVARAFDEMIVELRRTHEIDGVVHAAIGQEATAIGACAPLAVSDKITSTHRGHAHCIAKGADPVPMMCELFGSSEGLCKGKGGSMHIADFSIGMLGANGIVAAGLPIGAGAALASKLRGDDAVALTFFSDGAVGAGPFHEVLNVAALWALPLILVCENNGWAANNPAAVNYAAGSPHELAEGYGVAHLAVDGNDVVAVVDAAAEAVQRGRDGGGPTLIEARTFRIGNHAETGARIPELRGEDVVEEWRTRDPIRCFAVRLLADGDADAERLAVIEAAATELVHRAVDVARSGAVPELAQATEDVFA